MDEFENMDMIPEYQPTEEDLAEWEEERQARLAEELAPYRKATQQRRETAEAVAELDGIAMELLFKDTLRDLEV